MAPCIPPILARLALMLAACMCLSGLSYGQEICDNGRDDDGDGLVDLRDSLDCRCPSSRSAFVPSLVPNPSLEARTGCPSGPTEMHLARSWVQATAGTADYLNTCDFVYSTLR